jgi:hypothetical protein
MTENYDGDAPETGASFETAMEALAEDIDTGPALAELLAQRYRFVTPW